jgi:LPS sulfotransferase NodH
METLNSHKDITLSSELYNHAMFKKVTEFQQMEKKNFSICIDYLENKLAQKTNKYIGCKILLNQLELISDDFSAYFIKNYKNSYFIFLYRENMIDSQISLRIAHTYNIWHVKNNEDIKKRKIHFSLNHLYRNLEQSKLFRDRMLKQLENFGVKKIKMSYEKLFKDREQSIKKICDFLNISKRYINFSSEKKGNPLPPEDIIENYEEVKNYLKRYPHYYQMLLQKR